MSEKASLWWAYDSEGGKFSALPASPLLLPALAFMGLFAIGKALFSPTRVVGDGIGPITKTAQYQESRKRWLELSKRLYSNDETMQWHEIEEMNKLERYCLDPYGYNK